MSTLRQVHSINGIAIYYDSYGGNCYINPESIPSLDADTYKEVRKWCFANRRILSMLSGYAHSGRRWSLNFCDEKDTELILSSSLVSDALKAEFKQFLNDPFGYKTKGQKQKERLSKKGFIYVLKCGPHYKIGLSQNIDKRIEQLSVTPPFDVELIHTIETDDMYNLESFLHDRFSEKRKNGEWFELDKADIEYIKGLGAQGG